MRTILTLAALLTLAACSTALTPAQQAAGQTVVTLASATVPIAATAIADGQLICQSESVLAAIVDQATGKPFLVTGKSAQAVANVCALIGASPVPAPAGAMLALTPLPVAKAG